MRKKVIGFVLSTMLFALGIIGALLSALSFPAEAQQVRKLPRVGFLSNVSVPARMESFRQGLRDLGYIDGQNIVVEYRFSDGKRGRLSGLATDLVRLNVDVIVAGGGSSTEAAKKCHQGDPDSS
jgi:putative ABC transport system substrate-binding protein